MISLFLGPAFDEPFGIFGKTRGVCVGGDALPVLLRGQHLLRGPGQSPFTGRNEGKVGGDWTLDHTAQ